MVLFVCEEGTTRHSYKYETGAHPDDKAFQSLLGSAERVSLYSCASSVIYHVCLDSALRLAREKNAFWWRMMEGTLATLLKGLFVVSGAALGASVSSVVSILAVLQDEKTAI